MKKIFILITIILFANIENYAQEEKKLSYQFDFGTSITVIINVSAQIVYD